MGNLSIVDTTPTSLIMQAHVNFTNPTNYSATVPYFNIHILVNGTVMGEGIAKDIRVHPGNNTNIVVTAVWDPSTQSGEEGQAVGREWLSQYISGIILSLSLLSQYLTCLGFNTSMTVQTHNGSIPAQPSFGFALSQLPITFATPRLSGPKEPPSDDPSDPDKPAESPHFIKDATMHIISSTAIFTLASPFATTTMYITHMNATSYYEGHPAGKILYDLPFAVPPGDSVTPRLPVDWSLGGVGFEAVKKALGGTLKLSAFAEVGVRIGRWKEQVWYQGRSIGANIRL
jgi:hypothetical protein